MTDYLATLNGALTTTGMTLPEGLPFDRWSEIGQQLQTVERSVRWWIGDWLAYGERTYGETYAQAIEATGRSYSDLSDMAYVASNIAISERSENLSWSHHAAVAPLEPEARRTWLTAAEENDWSTRELRDQIKNKKKNVAPDFPACKRCGRECNWCRIELTQD